MKPDACQVAIVGAGPAGLAAAIRLRELGVDDVVLLEREAEAGGIPRHCGHSPFGLREYRRLLSGPAYAHRLATQARTLGVSLSLGTTVVALGEHGLLTLSSDAGERQLQAAAVLLCTGNREAPRSARLVSGTRPQGIVTTGALQSMVYLKGHRPFHRPLLVGTELVSFSALLTCRHAGIRPVMMIEPESRVTAFSLASWLPRLLGVPLCLNHRLETIHGTTRVEAVDIADRSGATRRVDCDGVIFSGRFVAEASLASASHLQLDHRSGGPQVDQYGRCSDPAYFAAGNLLHPVDTAGWCWAEGRRVAGCIASALAGEIPPHGHSITVDSADDLIRYFTPQRISLPYTASESGAMQAAEVQFQLRFNQACRGQLRLRNGKRTLQVRSLRARPETRQLLKVPIATLGMQDRLHFEIDQPTRKTS